MATISIVLNVLGIKPYITAAGIDYGALMAFCLVWGMGGAFISLLISKMAAKWMMGIKVLEPGKAGEYEWLIEMMNQLSRSASLPKTPEIGIYDSPEMNAFATGPTKNHALVAFSTGILQSMDREQIKGVAGHELTHIVNGDMVTMTLLQGVVNAFVMFLSRVISFAISQNVKESSRPLVNMLITIALDICLSILGSMVVMWFSRQREFRADAGSAKLCGRNAMISALKRLETGRFVEAGNASLATMKICSKPQSSMALLFASHPPLADRISALEKFAN